MCKLVIIATDGICLLVCLFVFLLFFLSSQKPSQDGQSEITFPILTFLPNFSSFPRFSLFSRIFPSFFRFLAFFRCQRGTLSPCPLATLLQKLRHFMYITWINNHCTPQKHQRSAAMIKHVTVATYFIAVQRTELP